MKSRNPTLHPMTHGDKTTPTVKFTMNRDAPELPFPKARAKPTETAMWQRLRTMLNTKTSRAYRTELVQTPGFPDIVMITKSKVIGGNTVWLIELKAGPLSFRPAQINFIKENFNLGSPVYVIWQKRPREDMTIHLGARLIMDASDIGRPLAEWLREIL